MASLADHCALGLDDDTLSAWRDRQLAPPRMGQISAHLPGCVACQQRIAVFDHIARDLARLPELSPGDRIVRGVFARIDSKGSRSMSSQTRRLVSGVSAATAVIAIAVIALLFAAVLRNQPGHGTSPTTATHTPVAPTATPTQGVIVNPPIVSIAQAWGASAASASLTTTLDSAHVFQAGGVSADGQTLFGLKEPIGSGAGYPVVNYQVGTYSVASKTFTPFAYSANPPSKGYPSACCQVSGNYAIFDADTAPGTTCGPCHTQHWVIDLQTGAMRLLTVPSTDQGVMGVTLSVNDYALIQTGSGQLIVENVATGAVVPLPAQASQAQIQEPYVDFAWPYLAFYISSPLNVAITNPVSQFTIFNLQTGAEVTIQPPAASSSGVRDLSSCGPICTPVPTPTLPASYSVMSVGTITGDTLFFFDATPSAVTLYELDHMMTPGATPTALVSFPNKNDGVSYTTEGANNRLVLVSAAQYTLSGDTGQDLAWDRVQQRFVQIDSYTPTTAGSTALYLNGDTFMVAANSFRNGQPTQVTIYDTATLRSS